MKQICNKSMNHQFIVIFKNCLSMSLFLVSMLLFQSLASAEGISVPRNTVKKPASDLSSDGQTPLDPGSLAARAQKGEDLSVLNPIANKMWSDQIQTATNSESLDYPDQGSIMVFDSFEAATPFTYLARVEDKNSPGRFYRFSLSRYVHSALLRSALLRKLGYSIQSPKYYKTLTLQFSDLDQLNSTLASIEESTTSDLTDREWILKKDETLLQVTFRTVMLEEVSNDYFDLYWGLAPSPKNPKQIPMIQRLSRSRAYRALIIPYVLADIPESLNRYSTKAGSVLSNSIVLNQISADSFAAADISDLRWIARKLATLSENDMQEIIQAAHLPRESLENLTLIKLKYRIKNILEITDLKDEFKLNIESLGLSSNDGLVKDGKVTQERIAESPLRFSHGARTSPYQEGDLGRYLEINSNSSLMGEALSKLNEKIQAISVADLAQDRAATIRNRINNHIATKPLEPLYQSVETWGGPLAGLNVNASRSISTGTYFESTAPVQLVDSVSIGGTVGYFMGLDGVAPYFPNAGGNLGIIRTYTHVRPINSIKEGKKVKWTDLYVPRFMDKLSKVLESEKLIKGENTESPTKYPLDDFLSSLAVGEVITISDTLAFGAYAQVASPLDALLGIGPLSFMNSLSLGVDANLVTLRQTTLTRTEEGVQIYLRTANSQGRAVTFDTSYFISLLNMRAQNTTTQGQTDAFVIDYDPDWISQLDLTEEKNQKYAVLRNNLRVTLFSLLQKNDSDLLLSKFKAQQFKLKHDLVTSETQTRLLAWKAMNFKESHTVKVLFPENPDYPELKPEDQEVVLFSHSRGELLGRDLLGLALDTLSGFFKKVTNIDPVPRNVSPNPANSPLGNAYWRIAKTESDLTTFKKPEESIASLQYVWGGWSIKKNKLAGLIESIKQKFERPEISYQLIEPDAFASVDKIDFYRITANLSLNPGGVKKIISLIRGDLKNEDSFDKPKSGKGLFGKIFAKLKGNKNYRAQDEVLFKDLLLVLGDGNEKVGKAIYQSQCEEEKRRYSPEAVGPSTGEWRNGVYFDCLSQWTNELFELSRSYSTDKKAEAIWVTRALMILDRNIPMRSLFKYLGEENYIFFVKVNGFRVGDEDGDLEFFSNSYGSPAKNFETANGIISYWATKTRISPIELDRTQGSFR